jgi:hypothetical protein
MTVAELRNEGAAAINRLQRQVDISASRFANIQSVQLNRLEKIRENGNQSMVSRAGRIPAQTGISQGVASVIGRFAERQHLELARFLRKADLEGDSAQKKMDLEISSLALKISQMGITVPPGVIRPNSPVIKLNPMFSNPKNGVAIKGGYISFSVGIKNSGRTATEEGTAVWLLDGTIIRTGSIPPLAPSATYYWGKDTNKQTDLGSKNIPIGEHTMRFKYMLGDDTFETSQTFKIVATSTVSAVGNLLSSISAGLTGLFK